LSLLKNFAEFSGIPPTNKSEETQYFGFVSIGESDFFSSG
jgi:hypothetical protein